MFVTAMSDVAVEPPPTTPAPPIGRVYLFIYNGIRT